MNLVRFEAGMQPLQNASSIYESSTPANGASRFTFREAVGLVLTEVIGVSMTVEGNKLKFYSGLRKVSRQLLNKHGRSVLDSCYCIFEEKVDCCRAANVYNYNVQDKILKGEFGRSEDTM